MLPRILPQKERQTRSAAREAIAALSTNQKEPRRHIKIEYEKRHEEDSSRDDKKTEDVAAKKRKKDTSTAQTQGSTWQPLNWREGEIGNPVGWGKGRSDTVVSSETTKLIYER